jgi:tellurite resistance protein
MIPVKQTADRLRENGQRRPAAKDNLFLAWEGLVSDMIVDGLDLYREARDTAWETLFKTVYESPWMKLLAAFGGVVAPRDDRQLEELRRRDAERWRRHMATGEFADAMVRIFLLVGFADQVVQREGYAAIGRLLARHPRTAELAPEDLRQIVREQSRIVQTDADQALATLPHLLRGADDRRDALVMLNQALAAIGRDLTPPEALVLKNVQSVLG